MGSRGAPWQISPDGRWVLWPKGSPDPNWLCVTRLDGSKHLSYWEASHWGKFFGWLPNNQPIHVTSPTPSNLMPRGIPQKATAFIYDLHNSKPIQRIPLPPLEETEWLGISPKGTIVLAGLSAPRRASLARIVLSGGQATLHRTSITLPAPTDQNFFRARLSPNGQRILWELGMNSTQLAISSSEGKHFIRFQIDKQYDAQWLPSGRAISFQSDECFYTLTVD